MMFSYGKHEADTIDNLAVKVVDNWGLLGDPDLREIDADDLWHGDGPASPEEVAEFERAVREIWIDSLMGY